MNDKLDNGVLLDDLLAEKRLWHVFVGGFRLGQSKFNKLVTMALFVVFCIDACFTGDNFTHTAQFIRDSSLAAVEVSISLMAFFIAGFAVFASVADKNLLASKAFAIDPDSHVSYLKTNMFAIMEMFCYLLGYAGLAAALFVLSRKGGIASYLCVEFDVPMGVRRVMVSIGYVVLCTSSVFVSLQIKTFIFNVYHLMMSSIYWFVLQERDKNGGDTSSNKGDLGGQGGAAKRGLAGKGGPR